jgi:glycosyltransferase involved in cell wall biosynthesis
VSPLTVVIPTYNRAPVLRKALEAYLAQQAPDEICELLVVDDGSTDQTESVVNEICRRAPFSVRYLRQENKGPAAARNFGIREAKADIILFTDSDIVPQQDLVQQHLEWHRLNPEISTAILGYVTWPPEPAPTPFMRWYGEQGALFAFGKFHGGQQLTFRDFYTCNLSLKTSFLRTHGQFDEEFKSAAFEDVELGYRLSKSGLRLLYNPNATAYHHQFFFFADACRKALGSEPAAHVFHLKEAGKVSQENAARRQRHSGYKYVKLLAIGIGSILRPFQRLLDSQLPLPAALYSFFFRYNIWRLKNTGNC